MLAPPLISRLAGAVSRYDYSYDQIDFAEPFAPPSQLPTSAEGTQHQLAAAQEAA